MSITYRLMSKKWKLLLDVLLVYLISQRVP